MSAMESVNVVSSFENRCLQEAVTNLCTGSLKYAALAFFSARCANGDKSGYGAGVSEACNFNAVVDLLTMARAFVIVTDVPATRQWILGDPADWFLGTIRWDSVLGHAQACFKYVSRLPGELFHAPWLTSTVGGFPKKKSKRGAHFSKAAMEERARASAAKALTSDALASAVATGDVHALLGDSRFDELVGDLEQLDSVSFVCFLSIAWCEVS